MVCSTLCYVRCSRTTSCAIQIETVRTLTCLLSMFFLIGTGSCDHFGLWWWLIDKTASEWECCGTTLRPDGNISKINWSISEVQGSMSTCKSWMLPNQTLTRRDPKPLWKSYLISTCNGCSVAFCSFGNDHRWMWCFYDCTTSILLTRWILTLVS